MPPKSSSAPRSKRRRMGVPATPVLRVRDFGPIRSCELPVRDFIVLIGEQASGKSTLAKLLYFFQSLPAVVDEYAARLSDGQSFRNWTALVRQRFMDSFGTTKHMARFDIEYQYSEDVCLRLVQDDKSKHVRVEPNTHLSKAIVDRIDVERGQIEEPDGAPLEDPLRLAAETPLESARAAANRTLTTLTRCEAARIFVPSARSLLSVLSTDLLYSDLPNFDPLMRQFVRRIGQLQREFTRTMEDQLENAVEATLRDVPVEKARVEMAIGIVRSVLKGDYVFDRGGRERIELSDGQHVYLRFASSGQQEVLWILLLLFSIILHGTPASVLLEEPEAHLFPYAQRDVTNLIALCKNAERLGTAKNGAVLTTHSPYVLTALNNLLFAHKTGSASVEAEKKVGAIVDRKLWLDPANIGVWFVEKGGIRSIMDMDLGLIKAEEIDGVSSSLRDEFDEIEAIEEA